MTQTSFDRLLGWLHPDRNEAGLIYESIRRRLIIIFSGRGCTTPEDLADTTINRVARRLEEIIDTYEGDPALYFYGVANKVHLEYLKERPAPPPPPPPDPDEDREETFDCLDRCLDKLDSESREIILLYYQDEKGAKIANRKSLAKRLNIGPNALRIRAHRIRATLQKCVHGCLEEKKK